MSNATLYFSYTQKKPLAFGRVCGFNVSFGDKEDELYLPVSLHVGKWFLISPERSYLDLPLQKVQDLSIKVLFSLDVKPTKVSENLLKKKYVKYHEDFESSFSFDDSMEKKSFEVRIFSPSKFKVSLEIIEIHRTEVEKKIDAAKAYERYSQDFLKVFDNFSPLLSCQEELPFSSLSIEEASKRLVEKSEERMKTNLLFRQACSEHNAAKIHNLGQKKIEIAREIINLEKSLLFREDL